MKNTPKQILAALADVNRIEAERIRDLILEKCDKELSNVKPLMTRLNVQLAESTINNQDGINFALRELIRLGFNVKLDISKGSMHCQDDKYFQFDFEPKVTNRSAGTGGMLA